MKYVAAIMYGGPVDAGEAKETMIYSFDDFSIRYPIEGCTFVSFYRANQKLFSCYIKGEHLDIGRILYMKSSVMLMFNETYSVSTVPTYTFSEKFTKQEII
jgi:hypothetical protein